VSRLFVSDKELHFINSLNKELIQNVVNQKIIYYSVSEEHTKSNDLYNESIHKTVFSPVEINARLLLKAPEQTTTGFSMDTSYEIEAYFHMDELFQRNITPREGDYMKWGKVVYEIKKLTKPQIIAGQIEQEMMIKAECVVSRKSNFDVVDDTPAI
jgi:hypothetical protein